MCDSVRLLFFFFVFHPTARARQPKPNSPEGEASARHRHGESSNAAWAPTRWGTHLHHRPQIRRE